MRNLMGTLGQLGSARSRAAEARCPPRDASDQSVERDAAAARIARIGIDVWRLTALERLVCDQGTEDGILSGVDLDDLGGVVRDVDRPGIEVLGDQHDAPARVGRVREVLQPCPAHLARFRLVEHEPQRDRRRKPERAAPARLILRMAPRHGETLAATQLCGDDDLQVSERPILDMDGRRRSAVVHGAHAALRSPPARPRVWGPEMYPGYSCNLHTRAPRRAGRGRHTPAGIPCGHQIPDTTKPPREQVGRGLALVLQRMRVLIVCCPSLGNKANLVSKEGDDNSGDNRVTETDARQELLRSLRDPIGQLHA